MNDWLWPLFAISQFSMSDFVRNQERLVKRRALDFMDDEGKVWVKKCTAAVEHWGSRSARLNSDPEIVSYADRELVWGPRIAAPLDCLIM